MILDASYYGVMPPVKQRGSRRGLSDADDEDDDYRKRRDRNNEVHYLNIDVLWYRTTLKNINTIFGIVEFLCINQL